MLSLNKIFVACFASVATLAIVIGCEAPATDGSGVKGGSRGDDDDDDSTSGKAKGSSSGSSSGATEVQGDCSNKPSADDRPACDSCARTKCCNQYVFTLEDNGCKLQKKCVDDCNGELICQFTCLQTTGSEKCLEFSQCIQANCAAECPSSQPDGGIIDPFDDDAG